MKHFWGDVARSSDEKLGLVSWTVKLYSGSDVGKNNLYVFPATRDENIVKFDITVKDISFMEALDRHHDLSYDPLGDCLCHKALILGLYVPC